MKFIKSKYLSYLLLICLLVSCQLEDNDIPAKGLIQFSYKAENPNSGGRTKDTPTPAAVLLTLTDNEGSVIEQNKKLSLYAFGSSFTSEGLQLTVGNYVLTQFVVLDAADEIIYAAPLEGSDKAQFVIDPLPINFSVGENGSTTITPQVLAVNEIDTPENFGYVSFAFEVVEMKLPKLAEIQYESGDHKIVYSYDDQHRVSKIEELSFENSGWNVSIAFHYNFSNDGKLASVDSYQDGSLLHSDIYSYYSNGQVEKIEGYHQRRFVYNDGNLAEVYITPGNFSHHEKIEIANYNNGQPSKIITHGYNEFSVENWFTTNYYEYDEMNSITAGFRSNLFLMGLTYFPTHLNPFTNVLVKNNITSFSTQTHWVQGNYSTPLESVSSTYEYNSFGQPVKEIVHNLKGIAYYPPSQQVKRFIYDD
jgi:hypothetical protein